MDLRYGENPHQEAAFYRDAKVPAGALASFSQLQGKELSYNNIGDADAAWECVKTFDVPACVIVKHANPCGVAIGATLLETYQKAFSTDPTSAFGGIIAFNREIDAATAEAVVKDPKKGDKDDDFKNAKTCSKCDSIISEAGANLSKKVYGKYLCKEHFDELQSKNKKK